MNEFIQVTPKSPKLTISEDNSGSSHSKPNLVSPKIDVISAPKSVNFGPGVEMLMNPNKKKSEHKLRSDIKLSELTSLERELNSMPLPSISPTPPSNIGLNIKELHPPKNLGNSGDEAKKKTWDGFKKFNEIPVNPEQKEPEKPKMSKDELARQKLIFLRRLEALEKKGIKLTRRYSMDSPLEEMRGEYEMIKSEKEKKSSVKFQGKMLMALVSAIEFLNSKFDPFDIKLDGWGEAVNENIDEYDDVFGELHEKYGGKAKIAPELKLIFMLGGSAAMLHMTNTMFKSSLPGMDDIMKQNPELMQQFTQAAVNTMGQQQPGFGNFMSNMMGGPAHAPPQGRPRPPNRNFGPPHMPERTTRRTTPTNRPDIDKSRNEMKGPSDISSLLSGLKTKRVNLKTEDNKSTISVDELKEMHKEKPQRSARRKKPKSERNTITLNL